MDNLAPILVTGAAGFIGSHTVDHLLAQGHAVVGVDDFRTGREANLGAALSHPRFRLIRADLLESGAAARVVATERPAAILHLAALVSVPLSFAQPELNRRLNIDLTRDLATAAAHAGVHRFVHASSAAVYGHNPRLPLAETEIPAPMSPYGEAKLAGECLLADLSARHPHFSTVALRYFNVFGPRQDPASPYSGVISLFAAAIQLGRSPTLYGDGRQTRDFIAVADVAAANVRALTVPLAGAHVLNICTGRAVTLLEILSQLNAVGARAVPAQFGPPRFGDIPHSLGDPRRAAAVLGFTASTSLTDGLRALFAHAPASAPTST